MNNYNPRRHRPNCQQLATLPRKRKYFAIENIEAATLMTMKRYKIIDEFPDEINDKIQSFMCGKSLLKMKMVLNEISQVVSCNKKVQFRIAMERLNGIIKGLKAKETEKEKQFILKNRVELVGGERMRERGYIVKITPKFVHVVLEEGLFTVNLTIRKTKNQSAIHLGPFLGSCAYEVINWSGFHYGWVCSLNGKSDGDEESDCGNVMRLVWRGAMHVNGNASLTSKFNLGPMPLWHGAVSQCYMPPPLPNMWRRTVTILSAAEAVGEAVL
jgi:hypothetical protein